MSASSTTSWCTLKVMSNENINTLSKHAHLQYKFISRWETFILI
jgi:hypothetical protein